MQRPSAAAGDGLKQRLAQAQRRFRLADFSTAYQTCQAALEEPEFWRLGEAERREAVNKLTRYAFNDSSGAMLKVEGWLKKNKARIPDLAECTCDWVRAYVRLQRGDVRVPPPLQVVRHCKASLHDILAEPAADGNGSVDASSDRHDLCARVLVMDVLLPHAGQEAKQSLDNLRAKLSDQVYQELSEAVNAQLQPIASARPPRTPRLHTPAGARSGMQAWLQRSLLRPGSALATCMPSDVRVYVAFAVALIGLVWWNRLALPPRAQEAPQDL